MSAPTRRNVLKYFTTAVVAGVVAGVAGYSAGSSAAPPKTVTESRTATVTQTQTVGGGTVTVGGTTVHHTQTVTVTQTPTPTRPSPPAGRTEVRLGVLAPLAAREGKVQENAARLAVEEVNLSLIHI